MILMIHCFVQVTVKGSQGHAGTVPMSMRQDPMVAAAEQIVLMESLCKHPEDYLSFDGHCIDSSIKSLSSSLVCTVGEISTWPSASNVIPGQASDEFPKCCCPGDLQVDMFFCSLILNTMMIT